MGLRVRWASAECAWVAGAGLLAEEVQQGRVW